MSATLLSMSAFDEGDSNAVQGNLYLLDTYKFKLDKASVLSIRSIEVDDVKMQKHGTHIVIIDRTIFHPQGGGQPSDVGFMSVTSSEGHSLFKVNFCCKNIEGHIEHVGAFQQSEVDESQREEWSGDKLCVSLDVDETKRRLHARIHSAGHALDAAMQRCNYASKMKPSKGYHFIDGPYVEYQTTEVITENEIKELVPALNSALADIVKEDIATKIRIEDNNQEGSPPKTFNRIVDVADLDCPCGGTHVKTTSELGTITVTKIKKKKDLVKVSYAMS